MSYSQRGKRYKSIYPLFPHLFRQKMRNIKPWYKIGKLREESPLKFRQWKRTADVGDIWI